jgi:glycosyltransferase involved in cell wall biosynthesis
MPVFNEAKHISATIESILAQDFTDFELIILDNYSTDETPAICREFAARDPRVRFLRNETNIGAMNNFNKVFGLARSEYFAWVGGHDQYRPTFLSRCLEPLLEDNSVILSYAGTTFLDDDGNPTLVLREYLDTRAHEDRLTRFNVVLWSLGWCTQIYGIIRASALRRTELMCPILCPDRLLLTELCFLGKFARVPEDLLLMREIGSRSFYESMLTRAVTRREARMLFWKFIWKHIVIIVKHVRSFKGKAFSCMCFFLCATSKLKFMMTYSYYYRPGSPKATVRSSQIPPGAKV